MDRTAWLGLVTGVMIGTGYAFLQWREARRKDQRHTAKPSVLLWGAALRILFLMAALAVVALWSNADKVWLVGSLAATYGLWFLWRMKQILSQEE